MHEVLRMVSAVSAQINQRLKQNTSPATVNSSRCSPPSVGDLPGCPASPAGFADGPMFSQHPRLPGSLQPGHLSLSVILSLGPLVSFGSCIRFLKAGN